MGRLMANALARLKASQLGFTLVEMLVVVAIIVALAAVIVPTVTVLLDRGEDGAQKAEEESLQSAMDALMATNGIINGLTPATETKTLATDLIAATADGDNNNDALSFYFRETSSAYCYSWDEFGNVTQKTPDPADC